MCSVYASSPEPVHSGIELSIWHACAFITAQGVCVRGCVRVRAVRTENACVCAHVSVFEYDQHDWKKSAGPCFARACSYHHLRGRFPVHVFAESF